MLDSVSKIVRTPTFSLLWSGQSSQRAFPKYDHANFQGVLYSTRRTVGHWSEVGSVIYTCYRIRDSILYFRRLCKL
jgi:hypothetical protein